MSRPIVAKPRPEESGLWRAKLHLVWHDGTTRHLDVRRLTERDAQLAIDQEVNARNRNDLSLRAPSLSVLLNGGERPRGRIFERPSGFHLRIANVKDGKQRQY